MNWKTIFAWGLGACVALGLVALLDRPDGPRVRTERETGHVGTSGPLHGDAIALATRPARATGDAVLLPASVRTNGATPEAGSERAASPTRSDAEWQGIPLDKASGASLGDLSTRRAFSGAMRDPPALGPCTAGWTVPPGIARVDMTLELRVRSDDESLIVEDAHVTEANPADADLERCVVSSLRGRRVAAPGVPPGRTYRIEWAAQKSF